MKLNKKLVKLLRIPTRGMKPFDILNHQPVIIKTGRYDEIKSTRFFRDTGQLHHYHSGSTLPAFFIQREDGRLHVVSAGAAPSVELISEYLDPDVKADVILCEVLAENISRYEKRFLNAEYGPLEFLARHHPSQSVRVKVIADLLEIANAQAITRRTH